MGGKALAAVVAAIMLGTTGAALASGPTAKARFTNYGFSLRYPQTWTEEKWCWTGVNVMPVAVFTSAPQPPTCTLPSVGVGSSFPPAESLAAGEMSLFVAQSFYPRAPGTKRHWNARIAGRPARVTRPVYGNKDDTAVTCPDGSHREYRSGYVARPGGTNTLIGVAATMCGPNLASQNAQFLQVLDSIRFNR